MNNKFEKFFNSIKNYDIPEEFPSSEEDLFDFEESLNSFKLRSLVNKYGMWAIVSQDWIKELAVELKGKKVLEIMAGAGWLSKALSNNDIPVLATDNKSWQTDKLSHNNKLFKEVFHIEQIDSKSAVLKYQSQVDVLIVSWPPYSDGSDLAETLEHWPSDKPIIYIGEADGGCNSGECFWKYFEIDENIIINNPKWFGIHDYVYFGYWKKNLFSIKNF